MCFSLAHPRSEQHLLLSTHSLLQGYWLHMSKYILIHLLVFRWTWAADNLPIKQHTCPYAWLTSSIRFKSEYVTSSGFEVESVIERAQKRNTAFVACARNQDKEFNKERHDKHHSVINETKCRFLASSLISSARCFSACMTLLYPVQIFNSALKSERFSQIKYRRTN